MLKVGLTGSIASGKSLVLGYFASWDADTIDSDAIARRCSRRGSSGFDEIIKAFGDSVLLPSGEIDRAKLAVLVFSDRAQKDRLEAILHPRIMARMLHEIKQADENGAEILAIEVPLLFETGLEKSFDRTLAVVCSEELQRQRLRQRLNLADADLERWLQGQWPQEKKASLADYVLRNDGDKQQLRERAKEVYEQLLAEARGKAQSVLH